MTDIFSIEQTWMTHEGGTKFYHAFQFTRHAVSDPKVAAASHFGAYHGNFEEFRRPVTCGQVNTRPGIRYETQVAAKLRRGYLKKQIRHTGFENGELFRTKLRELFGAKNADSILVQLAMSISDDHEADYEGSEEAMRPKVEREDTCIDKFKDRPAAWGTW